MINLRYFPDNTYTWSDSGYITPRMSELEAITYGHWTYAISREESEMTMRNMDIVHNMAEFSELGILQDIVIDKSRK